MSNTSLGLVGQLATLDLLLTLAGDSLMLGHILLVSNGCVDSSIGISSEEFTQSLLLVSVKHVFRPVILLT